MATSLLLRRTVADLIMFALLFHVCVAVWPQNLSFRPPREGPEFTDGKLLVKKNVLLPLCFISWPFFLNHFAHFYVSFYIAFSVAL